MDFWVKFTKCFEDLDLLKTYIIYNFWEINHIFCLKICLAGRTTTNEELEEMLEQGNSAVFTQGVSLPF